MSEVDFATAFGQLILLLTTLAGLWFTNYRESRNRKWDLEDRKRAREELEAKVEQVKVATISRQEVVLAKIAENTEISRTAFTEANNVNAKFMALANAINASYDRKAQNIRERAEDFKHILENTHATLEHTQATVESTHEKVESIERKL